MSQPKKKKKKKKRFRGSFEIDKHNFASALKTKQKQNTEYSLEGGRSEQNRCLTGYKANWHLTLMFVLLCAAAELMVHCDLLDLSSTVQAF